MVFRVSVTNVTDPDLPRVEYEDIVSGQGQLNKDIHQKDNNKGGIRFEPDDVLFGKLRPYLQNWLMPDFAGVAVGDWWVLRPNDASPSFIYTLIQSPKYQMVSNLSTGTKMPRSDWSVVSKTALGVPTDIDEQHRIGNFFCALDATIALHQRKLDAIRKLKKAYLQQMFPQVGECVPRVRFAGFSGKWEEKKLDELFRECNVRSADGELLSVTISAGVVRASSLERKDNSSEDKSNYKKVRINDIAYNSMRMWQGASGVSAFNGILSPAYTVITPKHGVSSLFAILKTFVHSAGGA